MFPSSRHSQQTPDNLPQPPSGYRPLGSTPTNPAFDNSIAAQQRPAAYNYPPQQQYAPAVAASPFEQMNDNFSHLTTQDDIRPGDSVSDVGGSSVLGRTNNMSPLDKHALESAHKDVEYLGNRVKDVTSTRSKGMDKDDFKVAAGRVEDAFKTLNDKTDGTPLLKMFTHAGLTSSQSLKGTRDKTENATTFKTSVDALAHAENLFKEARQLNPYTTQLADLPDLPYPHNQSSTTIADKLIDILQPSEQKALLASNRAKNEANDDFNEMNQVGSFIGNHFEQQRNNPHSAPLSESSRTVNHILQNKLQLSEADEKIARNAEDTVTYLRTRLEDAKGPKGLAKDDFISANGRLNTALHAISQSTNGTPLMKMFSKAGYESSVKLTPTKDGKKNAETLSKATDTLDNTRKLFMEARQVNPALQRFKDLPDAIPGTSKTTTDELIGILLPSNQKAIFAKNRDKNEANGDIEALNTLTPQLLNAISSRRA